MVWDGKGGKDCVTVLPACCKTRLLDHLSKINRLHESDLRQNLGRAPLPDAVARKYPGADRQKTWQYVFPASSHYTDRRTGVRHRHHLHETVVQKAVTETAHLAKLTKPATPHSLRHSFATDLCAMATTSGPSTVLGHKDVSTTMIDTHVLNRGGRRIKLTGSCDP
jgi:integrase